MTETDLFIKRVARMRAQQKDYFKTRSNGALREAMELERIVDGMLEKLLPTIETEPRQADIWN